ncbi:12729_t:CDS:2 [Dentiscutata erythropus]|uniref:12729_t:CDS:1 n=1 Tax=Dentiscutata erythropus TaxID=1348616 RepID=A0A9N8YN32_9GLOM|nr:12729_t:CDS:2 [Dentiscutata erythropus]
MQRDHNLSIDTTAASYGQDSQSSPLTDDEDINFNLVYASRTFRETVEGRVKVEKNDSLILLDDSNDYWWLVKLLKNEDVGYMPAEDIEMPFEKLARINKHKNVNLTIPINNIEDDNLSMNQKKSKTSKTVYFTSPECFTCEEESEDEDEQEIEEQKTETTNQENVEVQIIDEPEEMDVQDTASATPTSQEVEIVPEQTSTSARADENVQQNIEAISKVAVSSPITISQVDHQQNDEPESNNRSNKIKTRKQTGIFDYDVMKMDSSSFVSKTSDISNQPPETLMPDLGSDFMDFSDDDDEPRIINRFFGRGDGASSVKYNSTIDDKKKGDMPLNINKSLLNDQLQMGSSKELSTSPKHRQRRRPSITQTPSDSTYSVLRIYPGQNLPTNFKYKISLLSQKTTSIALIKQAIHRFKLDDENWDSYYISMKEINREERHLMPHDHPLEIFNSIVSYHSTPLPPSIKRTSTLSISSNISNISTNEAINKLQIHDNQNIVCLYLNKKSRPREQKLRIRILAYSDDLPVNYQIKKSSATEEKQPIEKKLVVTKNTTAGQIIESAMDKFGITDGIVDDEQTVDDKRPRYRLAMLVEGEEKPINSKADIASAYPTENLRLVSVCSVGLTPLESDNSPYELTFVLRLSKPKKVVRYLGHKEYEKTILSDGFGLQDLLGRVRSEFSVTETKNVSSGWHFQDPEKILEQVKPTEIRKDVWSIFENVNNELDRLESELNKILIDVIRVF